MARINIEDSIYKDSRFIDLILKLGSLDAALGSLVRAWSLAQKFYLRTDNARLIPFDEWRQQKMSQAIIDVGLAENKDKGVYVVGSDEQFSWLLQKQDAGKKSAEAKKSNQIKQHLESTDDVSRSTHVNGSQPLSSFLSSPSSSSISNSISNSSLVGSEPAKSPVPTRPKKTFQMVDVRFSEEVTVSLKQNLLKSWSDTFPKEYLEIEFKKARSWIYANDHKTPKSERGWATFLNRWLNNGWDDYRKTLKSNPPKVSLEEFEEMMRSGV